VLIFLWVLVIIGSLIGGCTLLFEGLIGAKGAPQQAAAGAIACGFAIIPYCIARAVSALQKEGRKEKEP
jgi:hypothetical protein